jgi:hypothetical protein
MFLFRCPGVTRGLDTLRENIVSCMPARPQHNLLGVGKVCFLCFYIFTNVPVDTALDKYWQAPSNKSKEQPTFKSNACLMNVMTISKKNKNKIVVHQDHLLND